MKKNAFLLGALLALFLLAFQPVQRYYISFKSTQEFYDFLNGKTGSFPLISAHRGGPQADFPENAIATFEHTIATQPAIIEFDVSLSKDSVLVLMHDHRLDRTTNGTGPVSEQLYTDLKKLKLKDAEGKETPYSIPTFLEVLAWGKGKVIYTIDVKRGVPYEKIVAGIRQTKSESNVIVITYNVNQAAEVHRLAPDLMISVSARSVADIERLRAAGVPDNRMVAFVGTSAPDPEYYTYLRKHGIKSILGTMGNLDRSAKANPEGNVFGKLLEGGADILSTDEVLLAGKQFDAYRQKHQLKLKQLTRK